VKDDDEKNGASVVVRKFSQQLEKKEKDSPSLEKEEEGVATSQFDRKKHCSKGGGPALYPEVSVHPVPGGRPKKKNPRREKRENKYHRVVRRMAGKRGEDPR